MSGIDLAERIQATCPDVPIVLATGDHRLARSAAVVRSGLPVVGKPFDQEAIPERDC